MHQVLIERDRPDFRVFIDLLYDYGRNVDTEGNSYPVNSRTWSSLYVKDRESSDPAVEVGPCSSNPSLLEVTSESHELEELVALYLLISSGTSLFANGLELVGTEIDRLKATHQAALLRAEQSIWHTSSNETPYPNRA
jgi:hypothetical protein